MTNLRSVTHAAAAALLLVVVTGCADEEPDPPSTAPATSPTAPPTTTSEPSSDSELAAASATDLVRRYYAIRDRLRQPPGAGLAALKTVATSTELAAQRALFERERERGLHQTGDTVIGELKVQAVSLDNSAPGAGNVPTVEIDVCWDVRDVDILDANGKSIVSPDRPDTGWIRYTVANYDWPADPEGGWRVATSQDLEQTPCAAS